MAFPTCSRSCERLRRTSVVPVQGLCGSGSKSALVAPQSGLRLGVRGRSDVTLLTHLAADSRCALVITGEISTTCRGKR